VAALRTRFLDSSVLVRRLGNNFIFDPGRARLRGRLGNNLRNIEFRKVALERATSALHIFSTWGIHYSSTSWTERPAAIDRHLPY
jgi:hypothetical protein